MNKKQRKPMLATVILLSIIFIGLQMPVNAAESKKSLLNKIRNRYPWGTVYKTWYTDFDGNGSKEMFALIKKNADTGYCLWFASNKETVSLMNAPELLGRYGPCKVSKKKKLFIIESYAGGSGSKSYCYQVQSGKVKSVLNAGSGLKHTKGNQFTVIKDAFDYNSGYDGMNTGHTYKRYYLKWTGKRFKEYVGTKISQKALKKYKGAAAVLNRAKREGFRIGSIYKRGNGIININLHKKDTYGQTNENLTLKISGKKVKLVPVDPKMTKWIYRYSYGGDYEKSMSFDR